MNYDDWKTESPEDERERVGGRLRRGWREGRPALDDDSPEADAYWNEKIDEARGK